MQLFCGSGRLKATLPRNFFARYVVFSHVGQTKPRPREICRCVTCQRRRRTFDAPGGYRQTRCADCHGGNACPTPQGSAATDAGYKRAKRDAHPTSAAGQRGPQIQCVRIQRAAGIARVLQFTITRSSRRRSHVRPMHANEVRMCATADDARAMLWERRCSQRRDPIDPRRRELWATEASTLGTSRADT